MGFITPCFIRKNTPELRKKLEELRYKLLNSGDKTLDAIIMMAREVIKVLKKEEQSLHSMGIYMG